MGSRGSINFFIKTQKKIIMILHFSHPEMTRFMTTLESSVNQYGKLSLKMKNGKFMLEKSVKNN